MISVSWICMLTVFILSLLTQIFYISKKQFNKTVWFGITAYIATIFIGVLTTNFNNEKYHTNHYLNHLTQENKVEQSITLRIKEVLKPGRYHDKYVVDILKIDHQNLTGKTLLNVQKDSAISKLKVDDILMTTEALSELPPPLNPNQFNYKAYLKRQYIYHQIFSENNSLFHLSNDTQTLSGYANAIRNNIYQSLKAYHFKPDELSIINALILGQRQEISKAVYTNYTNAGAIHILAVSGLHVGILLLILSAFLKPIEHFKHGKYLKVMLLLLLLWSYAFLAGASASIIRASTMFSIVAIGMHLKRPTNIYNTLAISIFFILLFKPLFLFDIGFQLSYLAVIAIVSIQPLLYKLWKPKLWLLDKVWQAFTVTIAAQFGVIPISLFYFHQFPGLFWLSNIVIIPLLGVILTSGILVIILAVLNVLPQFLADCYGNIISLMNTFFAWIANQEQFIIRDISFNLLYVLASYLIIIALVRLYKNRNHRGLKLLFIAVISLQIISIYTKFENHKDAFIIFHKSRNTVIGKKHNKTFEVFHNLDSLSNYKSINTYVVGNFISHITEDTLQSIHAYKSRTILLIDSLGLYNIKSLRPDYILLRNSPRINLDRVIDSLHPDKIIADGSNYKSYIARWEATCKKRKLPFHQTGKKGAFILIN
ncbi:ComEC family competence protein [Oceanihabitans sp.]|nr:ComEC family competence protein [Oceanihabitans sp.]